MEKFSQNLKRIYRKLNLQGQQRLNSQSNSTPVCPVSMYIGK